MGQDTKIEWTHHTFNPWRGCTKVAPECAHCYAEKQSKRNPGVLGIWGDSGTRVVGAEEYWGQPEKWNAEAESAGERRRVFCASLADVFEDWSGPMMGVDGRERITATATRGKENVRPETIEDVRRRLFALIDATPRLDWLILTKRPENVREMWPCRPCVCEGPCYVAGAECDHHPQCAARSRLRENVWLGTSAGTQASADKFIPGLLDCRDLAPVLFVSCEPMLEAVDFSQWMHGEVACDDCEDGIEEGGPCLECNGHGTILPDSCIDWLICGGESGPKARECQIEWMEDVVQDCGDSSTSVFIKQLGSNPTHFDDGGIEGNGRQVPYRCRDPKGGDINEFPESLRMRQMPEVVRA